MDSATDGRNGTSDSSLVIPRPLSAQAIPSAADEPALFDREALLGALEEAGDSEAIALLRQRMLNLKADVLGGRYQVALDSPSLAPEVSETSEMSQRAVSLRRDVLVSEIQQIAESYTLERAQHYLRRLRAGVVQARTNDLNDINLARWKEYDDVITDSLWVVEKRNTSGAHLGWYWGNYIPQIPHQMMVRYTKRNDWVLDAFVGSGTTLIECKRLGRNGIGIELNPEVARSASELVAREPNAYDVTADVVVGDSRSLDVKALLSRHGVANVQLVLMHPPYHDIIKFSDDPRDLSNAASTESFLKMFGEVVDNLTPCLEPGRYCAVVIGDKFARGEWIPLGFHCMSEILRRGFILKSIIVKNFDETRAKRNQKELWRYRALVGGFYVFKHEYILLFQRRGYRRSDNGS